MHKGVVEKGTQFADLPRTALQRDQPSNCGWIRRFDREKVEAHKFGVAVVAFDEHSRMEREKLWPANERRQSQVHSARLLEGETQCRSGGKQGKEHGLTRGQSSKTVSV